MSITWTLVAPTSSSRAGGGCVVGSVLVKLSLSNKGPSRPALYWTMSKLPEETGDERERQSERRLAAKPRPCCRAWSLPSRCGSSPPQENRRKCRRTRVANMRSRKRCDVSRVMGSCGVTPARLRCRRRTAHGAPNGPFLWSCCVRTTISAGHPDSAQLLRSGRHETGAPTCAGASRRECGVTECQTFSCNSPDSVGRICARRWPCT